MRDKFVQNHQFNTNFDSPLPKGMFSHLTPWLLRLLIELLNNWKSYFDLLLDVLSMKYMLVQQQGTSVELPVIWYKVILESIIDLTNVIMISKHICNIVKTYYIFALFRNWGLPVCGLSLQYWQILFDSIPFYFITVGVIFCAIVKLFGHLKNINKKINLYRLS